MHSTAAGRISGPRIPIVLSPLPPRVTCSTRPPTSSPTLPQPDSSLTASGPASGLPLSRSAPLSKLAVPTSSSARTGASPEKISLALSPPPGFTSVDDFRERLTVALRDREEQAAREFEGRFLGIAKILAQKPTDRPAPGEPRRGLNPRIAARDKWKRIEIIGQLLEFLRSHQAALQAWRAGERDSIFPSART